MTPIDRDVPRSHFLNRNGSNVSFALPKEALPKEALPKEALPKEALPKEALPKEALPKEAEINLLVAE